MNKIAYSILFLLYIFSVVVVVATAEFSSYGDLLQEMTVENGFFETLTVVFLFSISFYTFFSLYKFKSLWSRMVKVLLFIVGFLTFVAAMEEISWGQHIFHFATTDYFVENNLQSETNLHNLVDSNLFSSIIYSSIYTILVFIPLLLKLFLKNIKWLEYLSFNPHHILIVLFSSSFQLYFYNDFGVYIDMLTHLSALLLFGYFLWSKQGSIGLVLHYAMVIIATAIFMFYHSVFRFLNMQYEIREMFVVLAVLFMIVEFISKIKKLSLKKT